MPSALIHAGPSAVAAFLVLVKRVSVYPTVSPTKSVSSFRVISGANQMNGRANIRMTASVARIER